MFLIYVDNCIIYEKLMKGRVLMEENKLIIYKNSEGNIIVDAIYKDKTLWLSKK
mgnify:CR=1 FL=1